MFFKNRAEIAFFHFLPINRSLVASCFRQKNLEEVAAFGKIIFITSCRHILENAGNIGIPDL